MRISRRDLFKFAAVGATGLLMPPAVTYFLPPVGGWIQRLKIRRVQQYNIVDDSYPVRYDASWDTPNGGACQYHVDFEPILAEDWITDTGVLRHYDTVARQLLEDRMHAEWGAPNSPQFKLELPRGIVFGAYI